MQNKIAEISNKVADILDILGIEQTESVKDTPTRVAKMFVNELFKSVNVPLEQLDKQITLFDAENHNPVTIEVPIYSMCEHHLMPFFGTATVRYVPDKKIIGLSKIPRVINFFSSKPQVQERLTKEIGAYLEAVLSPYELHVTIKAQHLCVAMRGVKSPCTTTTEYHYVCGVTE